MTSAASSCVPRVWVEDDCMLCVDYGIIEHLIVKDIECAYRKHFGRMFPYYFKPRDPTRLVTGNRDQQHVAVFGRRSTAVETERKMEECR